MKEERRTNLTDVVGHTLPFQTFARFLGVRYVLKSDRRFGEYGTIRSRPHCERSFGQTCSYDLLDAEILAQLAARVKRVKGRTRLRDAGITNSFRSRRLWNLERHDEIQNKNSTRLKLNKQHKAQIDTIIAASMHACHYLQLQLL